MQHSIGGWRAVVLAMGAACVAQGTKPEMAAGRRNIVFILSDDHRHDAFGFLGHPFLETPHLDSLARHGVHFRNAMVSTALCSPSRASILTGLYTHCHRVIDNNRPLPPDRVTFPELLQKAGYQTAFVGKWHMGGESDDPRPGFDHWVSFRGQGSYLPTPAGLNVDGRRVPQKGYITDELTEYALDWLGRTDRTRPFFLYPPIRRCTRISCRPSATATAIATHRGRRRPAPTRTTRAAPRSPAGCAISGTHGTG